MSEMNDNPMGAGGARMVDDEHRVQVELIESLEEALSSSGDAAATEEILDRFREFTRLHFLSEELLMRLHAYPQHEAHLAEHHRMVEALGDLEGSVRDGSAGDALARVRSFKSTLLDHISNQDTELSRFMSERR